MNCLTLRRPPGVAARSRKCRREPGRRPSLLVSSSRLLTAHASSNMYPVQAHRVTNGRRLKALLRLSRRVMNQ